MKKDGRAANNAIDNGTVTNASTLLADMAALSEPGGLLEMSTVTMRFIQNLGLVNLIEVSWPRSF